MDKEIYWSRFADDFEERNNYVVGKLDMEIILNKISEQKKLKNTLEIACGNGTYSKVLAKNSTQLLATNFSDEMVNVAKNRLKSFSNITIGKPVANGQNLNIENTSKILQSLGLEIKQAEIVGNKMKALFVIAVN